MDNDRYHAITYFLYQVESMAPEVVDDLREIYDVYVEAYQWFLTQTEGSQLWTSEWTIVKQARSNFCPKYISLREAISAWAIKFNLLGESDFYQSLGLASLSIFYDECQEDARELRKKYNKELAESRNVPVEVLRRRYAHINNSWPYEEKLVLAENVFQEDEQDNIELSKSIGRGNTVHNSFFQKTFPFTFTPASWLSFSKEKNVNEYEKMKFYYQSILNEYEEDKTVPVEEGPKQVPPYTGLAWDPRTQTWKDFEESLDSMFAEYKKLYRERAENFLKDRGYLKEGQKRKMVHFKWLVHYLVQRWTLREIADHYSQNAMESVNEDTVSHGIKSAARLVLIDIKQRNSFLDG